MTNNSQKQSGSALIILIVILALAILAILGVIFWQNFLNKNETSSTAEKKNTVSIHPRNQSGELGVDEFSVVLPSGWSVQHVYEDDDIVKTTEDGKRYLISSAITDAGWTLMQNNNVSSGDVIKTVKTSKGTEINIVQTPEVLVLTTCKPTGDDCYLALNSKSLYIHLYLAPPGAQSAPEIDYSTNSAKEVIRDFEQIAKSLNI